MYLSYCVRLLALESCYRCMLILLCIQSCMLCLHDIVVAGGAALLMSVLVCVTVMLWDTDITQSKRVVLTLTEPRD